MVRRALFLSCFALTACQPAAFPRTADVPPSGGVSAEVALQAVSWEPQSTTTADGRKLRSEVAFFPVLNGGARASLGRCEVGGAYGLTRVTAEWRCGLLQERLGHPFSLAASASGGIDYGVHFGPVVRTGIDVSRWFGPIAPMVNAYLSLGDQVRYMEDPGVTPIEGPLPGSQSVVRRELRLTLPVGLAIRVANVESTTGGVAQHSIVIGAMPWFLLGSPQCLDGCAIGWSGNHGVSFSIGLQTRL